jgi:hypothetical protein
MTRCAAIAAIGLVLATMSGCATSDMDKHRLAARHKDRVPIHFSWTAGADGASGELNATFSDGRQFRGSFLQVQSDGFVSPEQVWPGWKYGWRNWNRDDFGTVPLFEMLYRGEVVANLKGPHDDRMRCRFTLNDRASGMPGGGRGQCQLAGGSTVDAILRRT